VTTEFRGIGTHSSPRAVDLNDDGLKDLIIGCGKKEFQQSDTGIIAVNGKSGKILWRVEARDQIYGSAAICDINRMELRILLLVAGQQNSRPSTEKTGR
jgi:glucose dehydrogenase